jgi:hypothetical protein
MPVTAVLESAGQGLVLRNPHLATAWANGHCPHRCLIASRVASEGRRPPSAASLGAQPRQPGEVGGTQVGRPSAPLFRWKQAIGIDLALEPRQEGCSRVRGQRARVVSGVKHVCADPAPEDQVGVNSLPLGSHGYSVTS